jgi:hypothetical protein
MCGGGESPGTCLVLRSYKFQFAHVDEWNSVVLNFAPHPAPYAQFLTVVFYLRIVAYADGYAALALGIRAGDSVVSPCHAVALFISPNTFAHQL